MRWLSSRVRIHIAQTVTGNVQGKAVEAIYLGRAMNLAKVLSRKWQQAGENIL